MAEKDKDVYWGVGMKGWVEIRTCPNPPRAHTSEATLKIMEKQIERYDFTGARARVITKDVIKDKKFKVTIHTGGKIIDSVPIRRFRRITGKTLREGSVRRLSKERVDMLLNYEGEGSLEPVDIGF